MSLFSIKRVSNYQFQLKSIVTLFIGWDLITILSDLEYFQYVVSNFFPLLDANLISYIATVFTIMIFILSLLAKNKKKYLAVYFILSLTSSLFFLFYNKFYGCGCSLFFKSTNFFYLFLNDLVPIILLILDSNLKKQ